MSHQTITAVFDSSAEAEAASRELATKVGGVRAAIFTSPSEATRLQDLGVSGVDRSVLEEAMRRGAVVLSATVPAAQFDAAADVIEGAGAVDLDSREAQWRQAGWSEGEVVEHGDADTASMAPSTPQAAAGMSAATSTGTSDHAARSSLEAGRSDAARMGAASATGREESIPVVEERLRVGKREASHGRVRIRSYVVETPVEEQVTLHQEHVQVERRPVDRPLEAGATAFQERTIEATETAEEAVIGKEARVKEEVVLRKTAEDRTETVKDTVRHTEVKVEDDRVAGSTRDTGPMPGRDR